MTKFRSFAGLLALSSLAVLPACSMFGGDDSRSSGRASSARPNYAAASDYSATARGGPGNMQMAALTPDTIRSVQQTLQQDGLYRGQIDGVWGPGTQAALRSYQQQHNMTATGQLDAETMAAMNLVVQNNAQQQDPAVQRYGSNVPSDPANNPNAAGTTR